MSDSCGESGTLAGSIAVADGSGSASEAVQREIAIHGQRISYLEAGAGAGRPAVVLLHGLAGSSATWLPVLPALGRYAHVIAPDLLGHGRSAEPRDGDYSLGAHAAGVRDLLVVLGLDRATVIGHSFGGGVAMQFAYQFPELTERLVLVASGGLGREVTPALRAATLPGTAPTLHAITRLTPPWMGRLGGQRLNGVERLRLVSDAPLLLIARANDTCIPVAHSLRAHSSTPGSRLEVFPTAGHFPHGDDPDRFTDVVLDFLATTKPSRPDLEHVRHRLRTT